MPAATAQFSEDALSATAVPASTIAGVSGGAAPYSLGPLDFHSGKLPVEVDAKTPPGGIYDFCTIA